MGKDIPDLYQVEYESSAVIKDNKVVETDIMNGVE